MRVTSRRGAEVVRLVVVDAAAYQQLLEESEIANAPQLARLRETGVERVPALLLGGDAALRDGPILRWEDTSVTLDVVGTAPDVNASIDPERRSAPLPSGPSSWPWRHPRCCWS